MWIRYHTYLWLLLLLFVFLPNQSVANNYEPMFLSLDSIISQQGLYEQQFNDNIESLKKQLPLAKDEGESYSLCFQLGMRYSYCISDSAEYYFNRCIDMAVNQQQKNTVLLNLFRMFTTTGNFSKAKSAFNEIELSNMSEQFIASCYAAMLSYIQQQSEQTGEAYKEEKKHYTDLMMAHIKPDDHINDMWAIYWGYEGADKNQKTIEILQEKLEAFLQNWNPVAGQIAYLMAATYEKLGNKEKQIQALCLASQYKIQYNDRNLNSLLELIPFLIEQKDYERAYKYMNFIIDSQVTYPDYARSAQTAQYMKLISNEMQQISKEQQATVTKYLRWTTLAFLLSFLLLIWLLWFFRKLRKQTTKLAKATAALEASNKRIQHVNKDLQESNYIKEEYIGSLFSSCSSYLNKLDAYRLDINRKAKTGKMEDILKVSSADNPFFVNEVKQLYQTFDETFLSIYPHFVEDFNTLLTEEGKISVPEGKLNTDLRIYALIWLGIESSNKIAALLHISPRTVYNANVRIRSHSVMGNTDAELFIKRVQLLGRENNE